MNPTPFPVPVVRDQDAEHLRLLSIFHYLVTGLGVLALCFICFHYYLMSTVFMNAENWQDSPKGPPPDTYFMDVFVWIYVVIGLFTLVGTVLNAITASSLMRRLNRTLCIITGGLNCLQFPLGTLLGVFAIIVLNRDSVREKFAATAAAQAPVPS
jgi:hypothetical protein